ncbi:hypothetical protein HLB44_01710 [Aquincola sp. S2]|uniref:Phasin domain-containing protein n=1 Tax=Pseudaquabacterium terrae TaxID=2732868 RepID=A0ABX2EAC6_9BURK|nr:hypothetical protein [Aquabacterium terrae]NRF65692.1 hypothetical protein [Aquabacterium terrae]
MNIELAEKNLTTADLAAATEAPDSPPVVSAELEEPASEKQESAAISEELAPLFFPDVSKDFRARWDAVQIGFVDDPQRAVREADELVAQVMKSLAETFSKERAKLEGQVDQTEQASTENLRVALRRYRSFFQRLLSL